MISAEAPVLFAKAAQIFITELTLRAWIHTEDNKRRTLQVRDPPPRSLRLRRADAPPAPSRISQQHHRDPLCPMPPLTLQLCSDMDPERCAHCVF